MPKMLEGPIAEYMDVDKHQYHFKVYRDTTDVRVCMYIYYIYVFLFFRNMFVYVYIYVCIAGYGTNMVLTVEAFTVPPATFAVELRMRCSRDILTSSCACATTPRRCCGLSLTVPGLDYSKSPQNQLNARILQSMVSGIPLVWGPRAWI